jgi:choline dehydrogenase
MTNAMGEAMGFVRTNTDQDRPDLQLVFMGVPVPMPTLPTPEHGYTILFSATTPHSRGNVRLVGPDVEMLPDVDPRYLADERDISVMCEGCGWPVESVKPMLSRLGAARK